MWLPNFRFRLRIDKMSLDRQSAIPFFVFKFYKICRFFIIFQFIFRTFCHLSQWTLILPKFAVAFVQAIPSTRQGPAETRTNASPDTSAAAATAAGRAPFFSEGSERPPPLHLCDWSTLTPVGKGKMKSPKMTRFWRPPRRQNLNLKMQPWIKIKLPISFYFLLLSLSHRPKFLSHIHKFIFHIIIIIVLIFMSNSNSCNYLYFIYLYDFILHIIFILIYIT